MCNLQYAMAGFVVEMSESEVSAMRETLQAQQELLQKLHHELDAEREASATAASEALSVILRLQGDKAAVKMETEQYKRLAEERMSHAEESIAVIEDIIYEREMEVASLDYQVQSYKFKLLSMGWVDPDGKSNENLPPAPRSRNLVEGRNLGRIGRRNSAPNLAKIDCQDGILEMNLNSDDLEELRGENAKLASDSGKKDDSSVHEDGDSFAEQIRKLNVHVKAMAGATFAGSRNQPRSPLRPSRLCNLHSSSDLQESQCSSPKMSFEIGNDSNKVGTGVDHFSPLSVHDVFEVPQADYDLTSCETSSKGKKMLGSGAGEVCGSRDRDRLECAKPYNKNEHDWLKKLFQSTQDNEIHLCKPSDIAAIDRGAVKPTTRNTKLEPRLKLICETSLTSKAERVEESATREEELKLDKEFFQPSLNKPRDIAVIDHGSVKPTTSNTEPELRSNLINETSAKSEAERLAESFTKEEELKLLKKPFQTCNEMHSCKPSDIDAIDSGVVKPTTRNVELEPRWNLISEASAASEAERLVESSTRVEELKMLKNPLLSTHNEMHSWKSCDIADIDSCDVKPTTKNAEPEPRMDLINETSATSEAERLVESSTREVELKPLKKPFLLTYNEMHLFKPSNITATNRAAVKPTTSNAEPDSRSNLINEISAAREAERLAESATIEEELQLLKDIKEKLNMISREVRSQRQKSIMADKQRLFLPEAMLHFWL